MTRAEILAEISANLTDNVIGSITPAILRQLEDDIINSVPTLSDPNTFISEQTFTADITMAPAGISGRGKINIPSNTIFSIADPTYPAGLFKIQTAYVSIGDDDGAGNATEVSVDDSLQNVSIFSNEVDVSPNTGILKLVISNLPTSSAGLVSGQIYNNSGVLSIV